MQPTSTRSLAAYDGLTVAVIEPGAMGPQIVSELTTRGMHVRLLSLDDDWGTIHSQLERVNADPTLVRAVQGTVRDVGLLRTLIAGVDSVMYLHPPASGSAYDDVNAVVMECLRHGVKHFVLRSEVGTSRPWALSSLAANRRGLRLGWQRRTEDLVRATGVPYTIIKTGTVTDNAKEKGWEGVLVGQGDVMVGDARRKPGLSADAAGALCASLVMLGGRRCTLEAVGQPGQPSVLERGYNWSNLFGVLMDDTQWEPALRDPLVMHDRATLFYAMIISALPITACLIAWLAISFAVRAVVKPSIHRGVVEGAVLGLCAAAALGTFACFWYFRRVLFTGCCCGAPLDYSTQGRLGASITSPGLKLNAGFSRVPVYSPSATNDSFSPVVRC